MHTIKFNAGDIVKYKKFEDQEKYLLDNGYEINNDKPHEYIISYKHPDKKDVGIETSVYNTIVRSRDSRGTVLYEIPEEINGPGYYMIDFGQHLRVATPFWALTKISNHVNVME